jgi:GWxTD domain-containing protein
MRRALMTVWILLLLLLASPPPGPGVASTDGSAPPHPGEERFFLILLTDEERREYESLGREEREEWRRLHWAHHDPTPTTERNEREVVHQSRVVGAIERFRDAEGRFVWDDRARAFIRFGEPAWMERALVDGGILRELWGYPDMLLWFEDHSGGGQYEHAPAPGGQELEKAISGRPLEREEAHAMAVLGATRWETTPEWNEYDYGGFEKLRFEHLVSFVGGKSGGTTALIAILLPVADLEGAEKGAGQVYSVECRLALRDKRWNVVTQKSATTEYVHRRRDGEEEGRIVISDSLEAAPGEYQLVLRLIDRKTGNHGLVTADIEVPSYAGEEIRLSNLVPATAVVRDFPGKGAFWRSGHRIVPHPPLSVTAGDTLSFYFEIYNIQPGSDGRSYFEVSYRMAEDGSSPFLSSFGGSYNGRLRPGAIEMFSSISRGGTSRRTIEIDTSSLPPGEYTLTVKARDQESGSADEADARFTVLREE